MQRMRYESDLQIKTYFMTLWLYHSAFDSVIGSYLVQIRQLILDPKHEIIYCHDLLTIDWNIHL